MKATSVELTVVIPAYNERDRLPLTLAALRARLDRASSSWEVLVADDGSRDGTAPLVLAAAGRDSRIRLLRSPVNHGKGHAVRRGVLASRGRLVLVTDADLATPLEELARLRAGIRQGHAAAIGSRRDARRAPARLLPALLGAALIRRLAVRGFTDTQCGFKLFDGDSARVVFAQARTDGWGFDVEILRLFAEHGWPVAEIPVEWTHRCGSKLRPLDYLRALGEVASIRLRYGPPPAPVPAPQARRLRVPA